MFMPRNGSLRLEKLDHQDDEGVEREEREFEEKLERDLKTDPYLEVHKSDIRAFRAFRRTFHLNKLDPEKLDIYIVNPDRNVAITRAFEKNGKIPNFHVLTETKAEADVLSSKSGIEDVTKGVAERHSQHADIVVVLDDKVRATAKMLKNVNAGGWLLCRMSMANSVRSTGKYELMGVQEKGRPSINENTEDLWSKIEIDSDGDLKNSHDPDAVTYEEALEAVTKAGFSTKNVLENYKRLIEMAKEQNRSRASSGETRLSLSIERNGETIELGDIKTILPLKEREQNAENVVIFKKHEFV